MTRKDERSASGRNGSGSICNGIARGLQSWILDQLTLNFYFLYVVVMHYDVYRYSPRLIEREAIIHST
jgi:hypothetical protein